MSKRGSQIAFLSRFRSRHGAFEVMETLKTCRQRHIVTEASEVSPGSSRQQKWALPSSEPLLLQSSFGVSQKNEQGSYRRLDRLSQAG